MTSDIATEAFCETVVPVILSNSLKAHILAAELQKKYGLSSMLCGSRRNLLDIFSLNCSFLSLSSCHNRLTLEQLIDFSDRWNECILVLIPVSDADKRFLSENKAELESRYLISEDGQIDSLPIDSPERWV